MVDIYLTKIDFSLVEAYKNKIAEIMPYLDKSGIQRRKDSKDAIRSIFGEAMVRMIVARKRGILPGEISFSRTYYGKPYIEGSNIQFNVSHSGEYVVCGISTKPIGVDIEEIKNQDIACIAKRFFSKAELQFLNEEGETLFLERFYELWVLRESYLKWLGLGLTKPLDSFSICITDENITVNDKNIKASPFFFRYSDSGYKIAVCSRCNEFPNQICKMSMEEVLRF